jgi:O-antigen/teichoic acid export membrane protein
LKSSSAHSNIKEILRAAFVTGKLTLVRIIAGFGRSKLNALILGAAGLGLYSQANYLSLFLTSICSLGLVNGMMQRISFNRERARYEEQKQMQATVLTTQLFLLVFAMLLSLLLVGIINKELFSETDKHLNVLILMLFGGSFFTVLSSNYMEGFFF